MLARFADQRRLHAAALVGLGIVFPLALILGIAAAVLTTLRRGVTDGMAVIAMAVAFVGMLVAAMGQPIATLPIFVVLLTAGAIMAYVLARSGSLAVAIHVGVGLGLLAIMALLLGLDDAGGWWRDQFSAAVDRMIERGAAISAEQRELWITSIPFNAMSGMMVSLGLLLTWGGLFIGRSWQARLVNPAGFRREFHALRLGRTAALVSAILFFVDAFVRNDLLLNIAAVLLHVWIIQGLALIHWAAGVTGAGTRVLVGIYALLIVFWITSVPLAVLVPILGLLGELVDLRGALLRALDK